MNTFEWLKDTAGEVCQLAPNLWEFVWQCLSDKTFYNGKTKLQYLQEKGYLPQLSESQLQEEIFHTFHTFYSLSLSGEYNLPHYSLEAEKVFEKVKKYLLYSWAAILITAGDWSVDRMRAAESAHGLKEHGFSLLEWVLEKKYWGESRIHLHKWPWNGALMQELREEGRGWEEIWVGDKLYFSLEDVLYPHINISLCREDKFYAGMLNIVFSMIKKWLKEKWFENTGTAVISKWEQAVPFCDLNEIFDVVKDIIAHPQKHFSRVFDEEKWKLIISTDFEDDAFQSISTEQFKFIVGNLWYFWKDLHDRVKNHFEMENTDKREAIYIRRRNIESIYNAVKKVTWEFKSSVKEETLNMILARADELWVDIYNKLKTPDIKKENWDSWFERSKKILDSEISELDSEKFKDFWDEWKVSVEEFFAQIFTESFLKNVLWEESSLNLNNEINIFPQNFTQWFFLEIPKLFPQLWGRISLISATRSDSHEGDTDFENDIKNNLDLLAPWWCLITDGIRESFSRVFRFPEIRSIFEGNNEEYNVFLVVSKRKIPKSLLIQKKHPTRWYLTEDQLREIYRDDVDFEHIERVWPYLEIISEVRERVLTITWGTNDVFRLNHSEIRRKVQELVELKGIQRFIDKVWREWIERYYKDFLFLKEKLSSTQREYIISHIEKKETIEQYLLRTLKDNSSEEIQTIMKLLEDDIIHYLLRHKWRDPQLVDIIEAYNPLKYWIGVKSIVMERIRFEDSESNLIGDAEKLQILSEVEEWIKEYFGYTSE